MAAFIGSLDSLPHVKSSNGFMQVMKFNSSSDEEKEEEEVDDDELEELENEEFDESDGLIERPLSQDPEQIEADDNSYYTEARAADLDQLYAVVDKSETRHGKANSQRKKLEMEAVLFRAKVSRPFLSIRFIFFFFFFFVM